MCVNYKKGHLQFLQMCHSTDLYHSWHHLLHLTDILSGSLTIVYRTWHLCNRYQR